MTPTTQARVIILIPVFNDWDCVFLMLPLLDEAVSRTGADIRVLLVDDGSTRKLPANLNHPPGGHLRQIDVLHLSRNLGHQRAIAIGLFYIHQNLPCEQVIVMDADGQDRPDDVPALLEAAARYPGQVIFAARTKRLETISFRIGYHLYRWAHRALTGISVRVGNFSVLPWEALGRLMAVSDLWSHYAAAVFRARLEYQTIPLPRGPRLVGNSRMNFYALLVHGLSAICVFGDIVSARALAAALSFFALAAGVGLAVFGLHSGAGWAIPTWALYLCAAVALLSVQAVIAAIVLSFIIIGGRSQMSFLPLRDGRYFIRGLTQLARAESSSRPPAPAVTRV